jgi:DNA-binding MarR family transcriptional regulator
MHMVNPPPPLPTLLSQALVAHTIELDNEAEHRLPHRTTEQGSGDAPRGSLWLVSFALWANVLQYLEGDPVSVGALRTRARTNRLVLGGLRRWGYFTLTPPSGELLRSPPQDAVAVRSTPECRRAQEVWSRLPAVIDDRWRSRFGITAVDRLDRVLRSVFEGLSIDAPAYLPVIHPAQNGKVEPSPSDVAGTAPPCLPRSRGNGSLSPLLTGVLFAFTVDFEARSRIALAISANTLRVLGDSGTRLRDLPRLSGVSAEATAMCAGWLERHGCAVTEPDRTASRSKVLRLTLKGHKAQQKYHRLLRDSEVGWRTRLGDATIDELRAALHHLVDDGTFASSPLATGLTPYPDNWRARTRRRPGALPHHPMVLHRGGYPDGS